MSVSTAQLVQMVVGGFELWFRSAAPDFLIVIGSHDSVTGAIVLHSSRIGTIKTKRLSTEPPTLQPLVLYPGQFFTPCKFTSSHPKLLHNSANPTGYF